MKNLYLVSAMITYSGHSELNGRQTRLVWADGWDQAERLFYDEFWSPHDQRISDITTHKALGDA